VCKQPKQFTVVPNKDVVVAEMARQYSGKYRNHNSRGTV
jgi:hypothetical protein